MSLAPWEDAEMQEVIYSGPNVRMGDVVPRKAWQRVLTISLAPSTSTAAARKRLKITSPGCDTFACEMHRMVPPAEGL